MEPDACRLATGRRWLRGLQGFLYEVFKFLLSLIPPRPWPMISLCTGHNVSAGINYTACCYYLWCLLQFMFLLSWFNLIRFIYLFSLSTEDTPRPVFTLRYLLLPAIGLLISCLWNLVQSRWSTAVGQCKMLAMCLFRSSSWYGPSIQVAGTVGNSFLKRHATRFKNWVFFFFWNMKDGVEAAAEEHKYKRTSGLSDLAKKWHDFI